MPLQPCVRVAGRAVTTSAFKCTSVVSAGQPEMRLLAIQPSGFVDLHIHIGTEHLTSLLAADQELGGSHRVSSAELDALLASAPPSSTSAGGSAANTLRGMSMGFGLPVGVVGAVGSDAAGSVFQISMQEAGVDVSRLVAKPGCGTARCGVFITPDGQRTMRTAQDGAGAIAADELTDEVFRNVEWVSFSCYAYFKPGLVDAIMRAARACKLKVALHLASWEVVRNFWGGLQELLSSGDIAAVFGNEDEAREYLNGFNASGRESIPESLTKDPEAAVRKLAERCGTAVVTLGSAGCAAMSGGELVRGRAIEGVQCVDSTGAGDLFAAGFLAGLIQGAALADCVLAGAVAGAAVIQVDGATVPPDLWQWAVAKISEVDAGGSARSLIRPRRSGGNNASS